MFEPHSSVRPIFINSDKRSPRAGFGKWRLGRGFASINIFAFNVEEPAVATQIQERRVREFGKSGNVVLLTYYVFPFFNVSVTIPSRYYQFDIVHIYDNGKIRASI